jgi:hypothetical protein
MEASRPDLEGERRESVDKQERERGDRGATSNKKKVRERISKESEGGDSSSQCTRKFITKGTQAQTGDRQPKDEDWRETRTGKQVI